MSAARNALRLLGIARRRELSPILRKRPKRRPGGGDCPLPVAPNRPLDLSGGAAVALEFDG